MDTHDRTGIPVPLLPWWLRWLFVTLVAGFIFYVSVVTVPPETAVDAASPDPVPLDKWRHFLAYAALGGALAYATVDWRWNGLALAVGVVGATVLYGLGVEFGQSLVPERYFSVGDAYANALGGLLVTPWFLVRPYLAVVPVREFVSWLLPESDRSREDR